MNPENSRKLRKRLDVMYTYLQTTLGGRGQQYNTAVSAIQAMSQAQQDELANLLLENNERGVAAMIDRFAPAAPAPAPEFAASRLLRERVQSKFTQAEFILLGNYIGSIHDQNDQRSEMERLYAMPDNKLQDFIAELAANRARANTNIAAAVAANPATLLDRAGIMYAPPVVGQAVSAKPHRALVRGVTPIPIDPPKFTGSYFQTRRQSLIPGISHMARANLSDWSTDWSVGTQFCENTNAFLASFTKLTGKEGVFYSKDYSDKTPAGEVAARDVYQDHFQVGGIRYNTVGIVCGFTNPDPAAPGGHAVAYLKIGEYWYSADNEFGVLLFRLHGAPSWATTKYRDHQDWRMYIMKYFCVRADFPITPQVIPKGREEFGFQGRISFRQSATACWLDSVLSVLLYADGYHQVLRKLYDKVRKGVKAIEGLYATSILKSVPLTTMLNKCGEILKLKMATRGGVTPSDERCIRQLCYMFVRMIIWEKYPEYFTHIFSRDEHVLMPDTTAGEGYTVRPPSAAERLAAIASLPAAGGAGTGGPSEVDILNRVQQMRAAAVADESMNGPTGNGMHPMHPMPPMHPRARKSRKNRKNHKNHKSRKSRKSRR